MSRKFSFQMSNKLQFVYSLGSCNFVVKPQLLKADYAAFILRDFVTILFGIGGLPPKLQGGRSARRHYAVARR